MTASASLTASDRPQSNIAEAIEPFGRAGRQQRGNA